VEEISRYYKGDGTEESIREGNILGLVGHTFEKFIPHHPKSIKGDNIFLKFDGAHPFLLGVLLLLLLLSSAPVPSVSVK
jgi:hypothetical protein